MDDMGNNNSNTKDKLMLLFLGLAVIGLIFASVSLSVLSHDLTVQRGTEVCKENGYDGYTPRKALYLQAPIPESCFKYTERGTAYYEYPKQ